MQVQVEDASGQVSRPLDDRFQEGVDAIAMIDGSSGTDIGFIADLPPERIAKVGNAALEGATLMLISRDMRRTAEEMVHNIEHVELETTSDFFDIFVEGCMFKPMERALH